MNILRIPNPYHRLTVIDARERLGLPVIFTRHPFAGLPFWRDDRAGRTA